MSTFRVRARKSIASTEPAVAVAMHASKKTYVCHLSPSCIVCNRIICKENERYRLYKLSKEKRGFSAAQMTMIGEKTATETNTLSIVKARYLNYVCNICRNVLVKVQRAQKHLEDAHKEYCTHRRQAYNQ